MALHKKHKYQEEKDNSIDSTHRFSTSVKLTVQETFKKYITYLPV